MTDVAVLGVRHHGPGSARLVAEALDQLAPSLVVIEGPPELDALVPLAASPDLRPPVAGLVYAVDEPRRASFYPVASFSPEWVALRWAVRRGVAVRFADLPAAHALVPPADPAPGQAPGSPADSDVPAAPPARPARRDPIARLATAAGYDDPERWWEDAVEHRPASPVTRFAAVADAMALVRADDTVDDETLLREAAMRRVLRAAQRQEQGAIAVVCGAYHAPVLDPATFPSMAADNRLLTGLPRTKVAATWAPWTSGRLTLASGYGAGVEAPGWYDHLFATWETDPGAVVPGWLVKVARELRREQLDAAPASVVEAARLAEALAAVRGRPSVGLSELMDATQTALCDGSPVPLALVRDRLVVGHQLGEVPPETPMVPLAADLARQQRSLRLKPSATATTVSLDLRKESQLARSVLLHRLTLLGIPWGRPADAGRTSGTFKEVWELEWEPEFAVALVEAGVHGTTIAGAAESRLLELTAEAPDLETLGGLLETSLVCELPGALTAVVTALGRRTAVQHDVLALLASVEPLARSCRYGDVRGVDTASVATVLQAVVLRVSIGLRAACASLDDDAAERMRTAIDAAQRGIALLDDDGLRAPWHRALASLGGDTHVHGWVSGRVNRLLLDAGLVGAETAATRMSQRLSVAAPAATAAAWLDGFLTGELLLLLHDDALLAVIDTWVSGIREETFEDLLPLLRRSFSRYEPAERRQLAGHLSRRPGGDRPAPPGDSAGLDLGRGLPAMDAVARVMGLEVRS